MLLSKNAHYTTLHLRGLKLWNYPSSFNSSSLSTSNVTFQIVAIKNNVMCGICCGIRQVGLQKINRNLGQEREVVNRNSPAEISAMRAESQTLQCACANIHWLKGLLVLRRTFVFCSPFSIFLLCSFPGFHLSLFFVLSQFFLYISIFLTEVIALKSLTVFSVEPWDWVTTDFEHSVCCTINSL
jgi:hypothetical protein